MNTGYQVDDADVMDYELWSVPVYKIKCRGPEVNFSRPYFCCIGAAQTFGRFVPLPYPNLLANELGLQGLNLGISGAGPKFFLERAHLLEIINRSKFCMVQLLSGRSVDNSVFETGLNQGMLRFKSPDLWGEDGRFFFAEHGYRKIIQLAAQDELVRLRKETRETYIEQMRELLARITVPKILLYFSRRSPDYAENEKDLAGYWGDFPHFVNAQVINALIPYVDRYIEVVSSRGLPQPLYNKNTGKPALIWDEKKFPNVRMRYHNHYYPSPQMHEDVFFATRAVARNIALAENRKPVRAKAGPENNVGPAIPGVGEDAHTINLPRLCYIHIPKSAGNSVLEFLAKLYGKDAVFLGKSKIPFDFEYASLQDEDLASYRLYPGHIYWDTVTRLPQETMKFSLLRHPVSSAVSLYFFWRDMDERFAVKFGEEAREAIGLTKQLALADWLVSENTFIANTLRNSYARHFVPLNVFNQKNMDLIAHRARSNMNSFLHVGTVENLSLNMAILCRKLGVDAKMDIPHLNSSSSSKYLTASELSRINSILFEISPLNFLIYEHARRLECQEFSNFLKAI